MDNDANAAAWGEFWAGAGMGVTDMVMFTLGTGVGGGMIIGGQLVRGAFDNAAELGHVIVEPGGLPCGCGQRGCLETYASAMHVAKRARIAVESGERSVLRKVLDAGREIECVDVAQAAAEGDIVAYRIWDEACMHLAVACVMMQHVSNPQRIVLAGGMIAAGDQLLLTIRRHFDWLSWRIVNDHPDIMLATLGNDAGLIGAAGCAKVAKETGELVM
jgi:glucokinase